MSFTAVHQGLAVEGERYRFVFHHLFSSGDVVLSMEPVNQLFESHGAFVDHYLGEAVPIFRNTLDLTAHLSIIATFVTSYFEGISGLQGTKG